MSLSPTSSRGAGAAFSGARVHIANNTAASSPISFDTVDFDTGGYYSAGQPTRLTAPAAGMYLVGFNFDPAGTPSGWVAWSVNASDKLDPTIAGDQNNTNVGIGNPLGQTTTLWETVAGTYFTVTFFSQNAVTLSGTNDTAFWIVKLG